MDDTCDCSVDILTLLVCRRFPEVKKNKKKTKNEKLIPGRGAEKGEQKKEAKAERRFLDLRLIHIP